MTHAARIRKQRPSPKSRRERHRTIPTDKTPRQLVLTADPTVKLDYYELLKANGKPCWFIRRGVPGRGVLPGQALSAICATPKQAWANACERMLDAFDRMNRKAAGAR